ncbi:NERD domain-containing protein [Caldibacillus thermolactis]|jgi:hypothetical protein|uniref:NERD domain-containing protein n=1 Tax=Pallidibacillus thermolactis TaxID=251051 RepID=A0ABT2WHN1_9BACI|nr:NERD domain-containing protein [Pallidibacillus thermolactis]MCU9595168.1 NERD domain-containing protein [Pallidibacillus thermolactis]MED1672267.1 NERD domain-containing protein [Pallidibacillus thermolactis subsp. kokeshiiformis]
MGQLIKLQDYISRYELDIYKYPARFIRLKRKQWELYKEKWEYEKLRQQEPFESEQRSNVYIEEEKDNFWHKMKQKFKWRHSEEEILEAKVETETTYTDDEHFNLGDFKISNGPFPRTIEELKRQFLEDLFRVQLIWASSTFSSQSFIDYSYYREKNLKYFIQRFPDTYLLLYQPIFLLKKAPVESETIMLTPTETYCITFLEKEDGAVYLGSDQYFWDGRFNQRREKFLNPLISLNRTESIVKGILKQENLDVPIKKIIISRNGYIDLPQVPYGVIIVDQRNYNEWFQRMRLSKTPLKSTQFKAAKCILEHCKTTAMPRRDEGFKYQ